MARGAALTPDELGQAAEVYARTASYAEAARAIGRDDPSSVRKALQRLGCPRESSLHARACGEGLRRGRKRLVRAITAMGDQLVNELQAGSMEPRDSSSLARGLAAMCTTLARIDQRRDETRHARDQRRESAARSAKIAAETAALVRDGRPTVERLATEILALPPDDRTRLSAALRAQSCATPAEP